MNSYALYEFLAPVLWQSGRIPSIHGPMLGLELTENERAHVWDLHHDHYYIFWEPADVLRLVPDHPASATWQGTTPTAGPDGTPIPRMFFQSGIWLDHLGRPYTLWWCCDVVATYVDYTGNMAFSWGPRTEVTGFNQRKAIKWYARMRISSCFSPPFLLLI